MFHISPKYPRFVALIMLLLLSFSASQVPLAVGQAGDTPKAAVDLMLVIDNSCSMFSDEQAALYDYCTASGSDPSSLRLSGADLFIARLGFATDNEAAYQAGVVNLGGDPSLIMPLQALQANRDALAQALATPTPASATKIVPAITMAYAELRSPRRRLTNTPAVVLITDGVPYPSDQQSDSDLERVVSQNPDIPIFVMLLQNPATLSQDYDQYIQFWQQLELRYKNVKAFQINSDQQILETYNTIVARLQKTISQTIIVKPGVPQPMFVGRYVRQIVVTVVYPWASPRGTITIRDPQGNLVEPGQPGVSKSRSDINPTDVFAITNPRLRADLKNAYWSIESDAPVNVFLDTEGAYRVNVLAPTLVPLPINEFQITQQQPVGRPFSLTFNLIDETNTILQDPREPIWGNITFPDGTSAQLSPSEIISPTTGSGTYTLQLDPSTRYPAFRNQPGQLLLTLNAGSADNSNPPQFPIAVVRVHIPFGRVPYVTTIAPQPVHCEQASPAAIQVTLGDVDNPSDLKLQITNGTGAKITLQPVGGAYTGDLHSLCAQLVAKVPCSPTAVPDPTKPIQVPDLKLQLLAPNPPFEPSLTQPLQADLVALPCDRDRDGVSDVLDKCPDVPGLPQFGGCPDTDSDGVPDALDKCLTVPGVAQFEGCPDTDSDGVPDPQDKCPTVPGLPQFAGCPDTDSDGITDLQDKCPATYGFAQFNGCPPPPWMLSLLAMAGILGLTLVSYLIWWVWTWVCIWIWPPPRAFLTVLSQGIQVGPVIAIELIGKRRRQNRLKIGGNRKQAHIYIDGLESIEFLIMSQQGKVVLLDAKTKTIRARVSDRATIVSTSNLVLKLRLCLKR